MAACTLKYHVGVDVSTNSCRAAVFDSSFKLLAKALKVSGVFAEQSSDEIWTAVCTCIRQAVEKSAVDVAKIESVGFAATCALVLLDAEQRGVAASPGGPAAFNVIAPPDRRAAVEAAQMAQRLGEARALSVLGSAVAPEMPLPRLLWLKRRHGAAFAAAAHCLALADWLTLRATGSGARSHSALAGRFTAFDGLRREWDAALLRALDLPELAAEGCARLGAVAAKNGRRLGRGLAPAAAAASRLRPGTVVAAAMLRPHAALLGAMWLLGITDDDVDSTAVLDSGAADSLLVLRAQPALVPGAWGPYFSAALPGLFLLEAGQPATGALLEHVLRGSALGAELRTQAAAAGLHVSALLNALLERAAAERGAPLPLLARDVHALPDLAGNRSPMADPEMRGAALGRGLELSPTALAVEYLAALQAIGLRTRHIVEAFHNAAPARRIRRLVMTGGNSLNPLYVQEMANCTRCEVLVCEQGDEELAGAAALGYFALHSLPLNLSEISLEDTKPLRVVQPDTRLTDFYNAKYEVFVALQDLEQRTRALMLHF